MFDRIKDALFGKRYREGWPRGVRPMFPSASPIKSHCLKHDPSAWEVVKTLPAYSGLLFLQDIGLISGVGPGRMLNDIQLVEPS